MNWRRWYRVIRVAVALTLLILALTPVEVLAKHGAIVSNTPLGAELNTLTTFTLSVTNDPGIGGAKPINQVKLTVDSSWAVEAQAQQPTPPTGWTISVSGQDITWSGSEIAVGGSQDFGWKATTATAVEYSSHSWTTTDTVSGTDTGTVGTVLSDWDSYQDSACTTQCDNFSDYGTQHTIYMYGEGFAADTAYRVVFWDQVDTTWYNRDTVDITATADGKLGVAGTNPVAHTLVEGTDTDGTWYATVYDDQAYSPSDHDPNDSHLVYDDSFTVQSTAIPEFPTVMAAIAVAGLCFGIYYWMRRKLGYVKA